MLIGEAHGKRQTSFHGTPALWERGAGVFRESPGKDLAVTEDKIKGGPWTGDGVHSKEQLPQLKSF